jgi:hypothetical protein
VRSVRFISGGIENGNAQYTETQPAAYLAEAERLFRFDEAAQVVDKYPNTVPPSAWGKAEQISLALFLVEAFFRLAAQTTP